MGGEHNHPTPLSATSPVIHTPAESSTGDTSLLITGSGLDRANKDPNFKPLCRTCNKTFFNQREYKEHHNKGCQSVTTASFLLRSSEVIEISRSSDGKFYCPMKDCPKHKVGYDSAKGLRRHARKSCKPPVFDPPPIKYLTVSMCCCFISCNCLTCNE